MQCLSCSDWLGQVEGGWESLQLEESLVPDGNRCIQSINLTWFMLPSCSGTPSGGVGLMDVENLFAAFQGNLKNRCCSKGLPWPWDWLSPQPSSETSRIGSWSPSCYQCHPLLCLLCSHPRPSLWLFLQVWLNWKKGLNWEKHVWFMSALPSAGICLLLPIQVAQGTRSSAVYAGRRRGRAVSTMGAVRRRQRQIQGRCGSGYTMIDMSNSCGKQ